MKIFIVKAKLKKRYPDYSYGECAFSGKREAEAYMAQRKRELNWICSCNTSWKYDIRMESQEIIEVKPQAAADQEQKNRAH